jgi:hypothetical protein
MSSFDYELSGGIGAQEYDMSEYWEQYDDRSRLIKENNSLPDSNSEANSCTPIEQITDEELLRTMDELINPSYECKKTPEKTSKQNVSDNELVKIMYGCRKRKNNLFKSDEDIFIENKIDEAFLLMKNKVSSLDNTNIKK